ncbi:hypothetical protein CDAR_60471 [Caerostris darwini]|uniref:Uncharacterized protein n=1 Tax=Caerostris darwini TaxID=1538125 RepID=A0AAV4QLJ2_9ARAC|nr:hypothetical protein CDAR_60471 [Caerostris darwini]
MNINLTSLNSVTLDKHLETEINEALLHLFEKVPTKNDTDNRYSHSILFRIKMAPSFQTTTGFVSVCAKHRSKFPLIFLEEQSKLYLQDSPPDEGSSVP